MKHHLAVAILASLGLLTASCVNPSQANIGAPRSVRAQTEFIQLTMVPDQFQAPGTIRARISTVLSSRIVGQISSLTVREGDRVRQGEVVAEIDNREAATQLRRAQAAAVESERALEEVDRAIQAADAAVRSAVANRELASSTLKRYDVLRNRRSVSPQEYDEVETRFKAATLETEGAQESLGAAKARRLQVAARIEQAQAEIESAQVLVGYSRIVSPIDGLVTTRHADPGMLATPGAPLLTLEDDRSYELQVAVEETRSPNIAIGQTARIEIDALAGITLDGRVREIAPASDAATRTYNVKLQITTPLPRDHTIRSGFFGRALFTAGNRKALLIPEPALIRRGQLEGVYIIENNLALLRLVKTGKRYDGKVEVISGVEPGTRIVPAPTAAISDGVEIVEAEPSRNTP